MSTIVQNAVRPPREFMKLGWFGALQHRHPLLWESLPTSSHTFASFSSCLSVSFSIYILDLLFSPHLFNVNVPWAFFLWDTTFPVASPVTVFMPMILKVLSSLQVSSEFQIFMSSCLTSPLWWLTYLSNITVPALCCCLPPPNSSYLRLSHLSRGTTSPIQATPKFWCFYL